MDRYLEVHHLPIRPIVELMPPRVGADDLAVPGDPFVLILDNTRLGAGFDLDEFIVNYLAASATLAPEILAVDLSVGEP